MSQPMLELFGWPVSPYTAKTRAQLYCKGISYKETEPSIFKLAWTIKKKVGRPIMPTIRRPDGLWLQDSSELFDAIEDMCPTPSFVPSTPKQRLASSLLELFGDEWLPMCALHYRWNNATNASFALAEFARCGMPGWPSFIRNRAVKSTAGKLKGYLTPLGVTSSTVPAVENTAKQVIASLEKHFAQSHFLFGDRPCLGDFSLYGPLWAHLYRDPGSRYLFDEAPNVIAWFERLQTPEQTFGNYLANDEIPETLDPVWAILFEDQWPWVCTLINAIDGYCIEHPDATRVPRALGTAAFSTRGVSGQRKLITFVQWKAQRPLQVYTSMSEVERETVDTWLSGIGGSQFQDTSVKNPMTRKNFKCVLETQPL